MLPQNIQELMKNNGIQKLNEPQEMAVKRGLLQNKNLVVASPTASGKTLIAEIAFLNNFMKGGKSVYIVPLKALATEKYHEFKEKYEKLGMKIAIAIGDLDSNDQWLKGYDLIIEVGPGDKLSKLISREWPEQSIISVNTSKDLEEVLTFINTK